MVAYLKLFPLQTNNYYLNLQVQSLLSNISTTVLQTICTHALGMLQHHAVCIIIHVIGGRILSGKYYLYAAKSKWFNFKDQ
jgi:hypothetical protein